VVVEYRDAIRHDVEAIATLHAESWRRHYRGAYSDQFLDRDVVAARLAARTDLRSDHHTEVAEHGGEIVGFVHTIFDHDPTWGALLDNLHVTHTLAGRFIGTRLMSTTAAAVVDRMPSAGMWSFAIEGVRLRVVAVAAAGVEQDA
jgi:GNAT superfamily N-acetyltransferase